MQLVEHATLGPYRLERADSTASGFLCWRARKIATGEAVRLTFPSPPPGMGEAGAPLSDAEAEAIERSLRHVAEAAIPGVPPAQAHWVDGLFFVASLVPAGRCLADMIEEGWPERLEERLGISSRLANLVATAHESGVAHGQLAPEAVYVHPEGRVTVLECGIYPMLAEGREGATRGDITALGRILYRYFAGEWPEEGEGAAARRNLERLPAALPRSMARKILAAAAGSADVPSARNLSIHLALDKAWVKAMSQSVPATDAPGYEDEEEEATRVRVTVTGGGAADLAHLPSQRSAPAAPVARAGAEGPYRPIAALSPSGETPPSLRSSPVRAPMGKLIVAAGVAAVVLGSASTLVLRPRAATHSQVVPQAVAYAPQPAQPARTTYAVRVGPYHDPHDVLTALQRLRGLDFEAVPFPSKDGTYLRVVTTAEEVKASRIARGLQQDGFTAIVAETGADTGLLKGLETADPHYGPAGVCVDFEAGQSKGWEVGGSAISMRNSSLFAFSGEHSLEVALRDTTGQTPAMLRFKPESIVLPMDRFVAHVLQPTSAGGRLGARLFLIDAQGTLFMNTTFPLVPEQWLELQLVISQHAVLPIREIGIEFRTVQAPWTGAVYVDHVEQQRPQ